MKIDNSKPLKDAAGPLMKGYFMAFNLSTVVQAVISLNLRTLILLTLWSAPSYTPLPSSLNLATSWRVSGGSTTLRHHMTRWQLIHLKMQMRRVWREIRLVISHRMMMIGNPWIYQR